MSTDLPDAASPAATAAMQRSRGRAEVCVHRDNGTVRLARLYQQGCAKAILPQVRGGPPEVVLTNTAGGVTGGDRLDYRLRADRGAALVATTQAAERIYRSAGGAARIETRLAAGAGAHIDWLPQETILFDGGRLVRRLEADLEGDAGLLALETLALGRRASGETVTTGGLSDQWFIRRDAVLVHAEALRLAGDIAAALAGPATLGGARALATLVLAAPDAADRLAAARAQLANLGGGPVAAAASAKEGVLIVRFLAPDLAPLRRTLAAFLMGFRSAPLPRVWSL